MTLRFLLLEKRDISYLKGLPGELMRDSGQSVTQTLDN